MAKMLAVELGPQNIRVNVICPGKTETEIQENTQPENTDKVKFPVEFPKGDTPLGDGKPATADPVGELVVCSTSIEECRRRRLEEGGTSQEEVLQEHRVGAGLAPARHPHPPFLLPAALL